MALERCTIHMWGLEEKPSLISPESIGLYWFLNGYYSKVQVAHEIEFVFSNNTDLSPNEELPLLVLGDNKISGFVNIVDYLMQDLTSEIDDKGTALLQSSLLQYTSSDLTVLTNYQLYLNKENYEAFTRRHFCRLLYWPMWYNTPLHYRAVARERCEDLLGYLPSEEEEALSGSTEPSELAQSKTFKVTQQNKRKGKEELQNAKFNMQFLNKLSEHLKVWIQVRERAMSEKVIPADLLMWANIYVQLQLPDKDKVATHLSQTLGSDFFATLQKQLDLCSHFEPIIPFREPTFQEQGNAIMSIYNKGAKYL